MKSVAVILSGCGVFDGAEIHESVLVLLALDRANAHVICTAPDVLQHHVVNHLTKQTVPNESRNVLVESARIARGNIIPLSQLQVSEIDAIVLPGGFGAAKNLCTFALAGEKFEINPQVAQVLQAAHRAGKPSLVCTPRLSRLDCLVPGGIHHRYRCRHGQNCKLRAPSTSTGH